MSDPMHVIAVDRIVERIGSSRDNLLPILQAVQAEFAYLPREALERVVERTGIPLSAIWGLSTFYAQFRHQPCGRHRIRVCVGTACHVKGAEALHDEVRRRLELAPGEDTDRERLFTVQKVACLGCCMLAPVIQIDEVIYGHMSPEKVPAVLHDFLRSAAGSSATKKRAASAAPRGEVRLCCCSSCNAAGSGAVYAELEREAAALDLPVAVKSVGCTGVSFEAPLVDVVAPDGQLFRYGRVRTTDCRRVLLHHFKPAGVLPRLSASVEGWLERLLPEDDAEVIRYTPDRRDQGGWGGASQCCLATEHAGEIAPLDLDDYRRHGGFAALEKASALAPEALIAEITASGLRGRGGAGFPTGRKWATVRAAAGSPKYVICNGDEGDPGAFMDRMILESFPYRVIEGMLIAAIAAGAGEGIFYVREEYPLAVRRLREAIQLFEQSGLNSRGVRLRVVEGAGAFVCGEETALIAALEGRRGAPTFRPPYPAERGFHGCPTLVNNVETLALVPWIVRHGAAAFAAIGTKGSAGSKTFALAGKIERGGLIEVPMGLSLREIVETVGGGAEEDRKVKAVQIGGPSGGCLPASLADLPVDYEALVSAGAIMGSGGLVVLDNTDCMVDVARYFLSFTRTESCGKCTFCRVGTIRLLEMLDRFCAGTAKEADIAELEDLAKAVQAGSLCGLGRTAPNSVLTTLKYFRHEYVAHAQGRCPAGKCKSLIRYVISEDCIGCTRCAQHCPVDAIPLRPYQRHEIQDDLCTRCDTCRKVCPSHAVKIRPRGDGGGDATAEG